MQSSRLFHTSVVPLSRKKKATITFWTSARRLMIVPTTRHSTKCLPFILSTKSEGMIIQDRKTTTSCRLRWTTTTMVCVSFEIKPRCGLGEYRQRNMPIGKTFRISPPVSTTHVERIYGTSYVSPLM